MMMGHKHLHELLKEDQEPFLLKNYIADRRSHLGSQKPIPKTRLQPQKRKSIVQISNTKLNLCKQVCFFSSSHHSPDVRRSPFLNLPSPAPAKSRASSLLLEAATKIDQTETTRAQIKNSGFGLFGSILKRLGGRNRSRKCGVSERKSVVKSEKVQENVGVLGEKAAFEVGFDCSSCSSSRRNSGVSSESNDGNKYLDMQEIEEKRFCSSPVSPFPSSLQKSPSSGRRTTPPLSPASSPSHRSNQENGEAENIQKVQTNGEEEKEQFSPVSVMDPPFEDDTEGHEDGDEYDTECSSYAVLQRAKEQLLERLLRFEKLAELDPVELEKSILESHEDNDEEEEFEEAEERRNGDSKKKYKVDANRLVLDLIAEEKRIVAKRVFKRKEMENKTIDIMVELDFRKDVDGWKRIVQEQMEEAAPEVELSIFGLLVEELLEELVCLTLV